MSEKPSLSRKKDKKHLSKPAIDFSHITEGKVIEWNDERGFGFIQAKESKERIFFHVKDLELNQGRFRPQVNEDVWFTAFWVAEKGWKAQRVTSAARQYECHRQIQNQQRKQQRQSALSVKFLISLVITITWLAYLAMKSWLLMGTVAILSFILFMLYGSDKRAANEDEWRIPEAHLHFLALMGGWCGGLMARYHYEHKTTKTEFVVVFWITVIINVVGLLYFMPNVVKYLNLLL